MGAKRPEYFLYYRDLCTVSSAGIWNPGTQDFFSSTGIFFQYRDFFAVPGFEIPVPGIFFKSSFFFYEHNQIKLTQEWNVYKCVCFHMYKCVRLYVY